LTFQTAGRPATADEIVEGYVFLSI